MSTTIYHLYGDIIKHEIMMRLSHADKKAFSQTCKHVWSIWRSNLILPTIQNIPELTQLFCRCIDGGTDQDYERMRRNLLYAVDKFSTPKLFSLSWCHQVAYDSLDYMITHYRMENIKIVKLVEICASLNNKKADDVFKYITKLQYFNFTTNTYEEPNCGVIDRFAFSWSSRSYATNRISIATQHNGLKLLYKLGLHHCIENKQQRHFDKTTCRIRHEYDIVNNLVDVKQNKREIYNAALRTCNQKYMRSHEDVSAFIQKSNDFSNTYIVDIKQIIEERARREAADNVGG